jgi:hypothetical protein
MFRSFPKVFWLCLVDVFVYKMKKISQNLQFLSTQKPTKTKNAQIIILKYAYSIGEAKKIPLKRSKAESVESKFL